MASAKARCESISLDDEPLFQASLISAENVTEAEFGSDLVAYAENEKCSAVDVLNEKIFVDLVVQGIDGRPRFECKGNGCFVQGKRIKKPRTLRTSVIDLQLKMMGDRNLG